jgi:hypothetical protein
MKLEGLFRCSFSYARRQRRPQCAGSLTNPTVIQIRRGTIIAFYIPEQKSTDMDANSNEALSDFQFYAEHVKQLQSKFDRISRSCTFGPFAFI